MKHQIFLKIFSVTVQIIKEFIQNIFIDHYATDLKGKGKKGKFI